MEEQLGIGSVVISKCGRDKGRYFIVLKSEGGYVYLTDGAMRKLASPKKKKIKHITITSDKLENIADKLKLGKKVFDGEIKSALRVYNQKEQ
ncbi:MAG: RNA-binding protein [Clostridia bacterium]|nr:RNA-binding protein [Clostridia bacterium]